MSCLGPTYNPQPPREWYRFSNNCPTNLPEISLYDLINPDNIISDYYKYRSPFYKKGNILQYKANSANITQSQRYAQIAQGMWTNRTKTWSSQTVNVTNPNSDILKRVNYYTVISPNYSVNGTEIIQPVLSTSNITNCAVNVTKNNAVLPKKQQSGTPPNNPLPPVVQTTSGPSMPPYIYRPTVLKPKVIQTGGSLLCNIVENPCTGEILDRTYTKDCYPTTDSDVPGTPTLLCWNSGLQTYYPKTKLTYGTSGNKWPVNSKAIFSAQ
jgi:hypothetical protein